MVQFAGWHSVTALCPVRQNRSGCRRVQGHVVHMIVRAPDVVAAGLRALDGWPRVAIPRLLQAAHRPTRFMPRMLLRKVTAAINISEILHLRSELCSGIFVPLGSSSNHSRRARRPAFFCCGSSIWIESPTLFGRA